MQLGGNLDIRTNRCCYLQVQVSQIPQGIKSRDGLYFVVVQIEYTRRVAAFQIRDLADAPPL